SVPATPSFCAVIPLVDKGTYGFHGPCPHRTLLRPLDIGTAMPAGPRLVLLGARIVKTLRPERSLLWFSSRRRSDGLAELIRATATKKWGKAGPFRRIAPCLLRVRIHRRKVDDCQRRSGFFAHGSCFAAVPEKLLPLICDTRQIPAENPQKKPVL